MTWKVFKRAALGACVASPLALGIVFTHTGVNGNYNDESKWSRDGGFCYSSPLCYPHSLNDDAIIDQMVAITLSASAETDSIDDLYISGAGMGPTSFSTDGEERTLKCESVTISDAQVQVTDLAGVEASGTEPCPEE